MVLCRGLPLCFPFDPLKIKLIIDKLLFYYRILFQLFCYRILVGAPLATSADPILNTHQQTGALYKCAIDLKNPAVITDCTELEYPDTNCELYKHHMSCCCNSASSLYLA